MFNLTVHSYAKALPGSLVKYQGEPMTVVKRTHCSVHLQADSGDKPTVVTIKHLKERAEKMTESCRAFGRSLHKESQHFIYLPPRPAEAADLTKPNLRAELLHSLARNQVQ